MRIQNIEIMRRESDSIVTLLVSKTAMFCFYAMLQTIFVVSKHQEKLSYISKHKYTHTHARGRAHFMLYIHNNGISFAIYETNNNYIIFQLCTVWQRSLMSIHNAMNSRQIINIVGCLSDYTNYTVH